MKPTITPRAIKAALRANVSAMKRGNIVVRRDQPADQGTVAEVIIGVIILVNWHGRCPSYEYAHDLCKQEPQPNEPIKKGRRP